MNLVYRYKHLRCSQLHPYNSIWSKLLDWNYSINRDRMLNDKWERGRDRALIAPGSSVNIRLVFNADLVDPDELDSLLLNNYQEIELKKPGMLGVITNPIVTSRDVKETKYGMRHLIIDILADSIEIKNIF